MKQKEIINNFCKDAKFYMVKFDAKNDDEFGKILSSEELQKLNLEENEIHRSIEYKNGDTLFVYSLLPKEENHKTNNPLKLLIENIKEARVIEQVYKGIFRWVYDGLSVKAYAIVPSGCLKSNSTLTRYGGTQTFIKILRQHLENISKMYKGITPDYNFLSNTSKIEEAELSIGSINNFNKTYCIGIDVDMAPPSILRCSQTNTTIWQPLNTLNMKYWAKEINPDFIVEAKHIKLNQTIDIDETFSIYPPCIKNIMELKNKGNYNRFLLARFLLSIHGSRDAKFVYDTVLSDKEKEHIKNGNCSTQWNYILNNIKRYDCPTCSQLRSFCDRKCNFTHPLEDVQKKLDEKNVHKRFN